MTADHAANDALVDLAALRLGGMVLTANDEFFAPKEALLDPMPPVFDPLAFTDRGKLMDGWETRRRRSPGSDWCVVRLGVRGIVRSIVVDTTFFRGNYPQACTLDHAQMEDPTALPKEEDWTPLLERSALSGDTVNTFAVTTTCASTHLRLWIHPDGGVARLRVFGEVVPDLRGHATTDGSLDLAALVHGATVENASGEFFSPRHNLIMVGDARDMGDGWETQRRRDDGHDWAVVRLAASGRIDLIEIDTTHFKGNSPGTCSVDAETDGQWHELLPRQSLAPHMRHVFRPAVDAAAARIRLNVYPDGGVARLRLPGRVSDEGWREAGLRWFNSLTSTLTEAALHACCASPAWTKQMATERPFATMADLFATAERMWLDLDESDWHDAFAAHPRIGDRSGAAHTRTEQAGTTGAAAETLAALADGNRRYEERFDRVFLICATGKSADDMLAALQQRLDADPADELRTAAGEQTKITALRLERLFRPEGLDMTTPGTST